MKWKLAWAVGLLLVLALIMVVGCSEKHEEVHGTDGRGERIQISVEND
jgi:hypothetical protein